MTNDPWDYAHITAFNFLPFLLATIGKAPRWVVHLLTVIWFAALTMLIAVFAWIGRRAAMGEFDAAANSSLSPVK
jgi:cbb3-type cytochrome oxidase subunit 3